MSGIGRLPPEKVQAEISGSRVGLARKVPLASGGFVAEVAGLQIGR